MPLLYILDTALIAISLFNTITMLWLGITVLLNAERRVWGTWVAGGALLFGSGFFAVHSTIVGQPIGALVSEMVLWWQIGWTPFIAAPFLWYVVMAWYSGALHTRRHRLWALIAGALGAAALALLLVANPLPSYDQVIERVPVALFTIVGIPVAVLVYPAYSVLCVVLALAALRHPAPAGRLMGEIGRMRARPWLVAASLALLAVSIAAGIAVAWLLGRVRAGEAPLPTTRSLAALISFDLLLSALIALIVVLLGKAVVAYEIFTGKTLPRGGLARFWRSSLVLAAGYGLLIGASIEVGIAPIYQIVGVTLLVTLLYGLVSWRTFVERERGVERLRPFVSSEKLYDRLLGPFAPSAVDLATPFRALCAEVLDTSLAQLVALGPLASLIGTPLVFPDTTRVAPLATSALAELVATLQSPQQLCLAVDRQHYSGAVWAVPLWNERGLVGVLLLGEKRNDGLYTQEEIEIARAAGERLIDTRASAELSQRLVALQRQRLAESQIVDRRTRRVLHDDVLPQIHHAILQIADQRSQIASETQQAAWSELQADLANTHRQIANLLHELPPTAEAELLRLGLIGALRHVVDGELRGAFDAVRWQVDHHAEQRARALPALNAEVLFYAAREIIRNAARHGRAGGESRPLILALDVAYCNDDRSNAHARPTLRISIADNGVGLGAAQPSAGSGQGLALHTTMLAVLGGTVAADSAPDGGARFVLALPCAVQA